MTAAFMRVPELAVAAEVSLATAFRFPRLLVALIDRIGSALVRHMGDAALQRLTAAGQAAPANGTYVGAEQSLKHMHGWRDSLLRQAGARQKPGMADRGHR